ncbi:MAG: DedA family protein [Thermoguttaceae bacterium]|nr:DedA family protein [Thermoguttaceae bacterium]
MTASYVRNSSGKFMEDREQSAEPRKTNLFLLPILQCKRFLRFLYDWVLSWAHSKYGTIGLCALSFAESSFFPIPPDVLQLALSIERPKRAFFYAGVSAVASVCGALLGWYIGFGLWEVVGPYFVPNIISQSNMDKVARFFQDWGFWALFAAAFTPLPFKAFTITAGIGHMAIPIFLTASLVGRSARFFLMGSLVYIFGPSIKAWIDKYFGILTLAFLVLLIGGFYCIKFLF